MTSVVERPEIASSSGERRYEQAEIRRGRILYAPMNDFLAPTFSGGAHEDNTELWHWLAVSMPCDQMQPWIVVHFGLIILLETEAQMFLVEGSYNTPTLQQLIWRIVTST